MNKAIELEPKHLLAHSCLGQVYFDEAQLSVELARNIAADIYGFSDPEAKQLWQEGKNQLYEGNLNKAFELFESGYLKDPDSRMILYYRATIYAQWSHYYFNKAVQISSSDTNAYHALSRVFSLLGEIYESIGRNPKKQAQVRDPEKDRKLQLEDSDELADLIDELDI